MANIAIYTESSNDDKTIACLANKLAEFKQVRPIVIHKIHKGSYLNRKFHEVIRNWLKKVDCIIFLTDRDGPIANHQRRQNQNSLINRIESIVDNNKVFLVEIVHELEAWLLVDCIGIFCYYATTKNARNYKDNCRIKYQQIEHSTGGLIDIRKGIQKRSLKQCQVLAMRKNTWLIFLKTYFVNSTPTFQKRMSDVKNTVRPYLTKSQRSFALT